MLTVWEGRIVGTFEGYENGRVFELSDGSRWKQEDRNPRIHLSGRTKSQTAPRSRESWTYLDVEGTSAVVMVVRDRGMSSIHAGAF